MPTASNLLKRNYAYYWRRSVAVGGHPISLTLSLLTKAGPVARHRGGLMTARSEEVRVSLYDRIANEGLSPEQQTAVFRQEMTDYRNALEHLIPTWEAMPLADQLCSTESNLHIFEALWGKVAELGMTPELADAHLLRRHFPGLEPTERHGLGLLLRSAANLPASFGQEVDRRLASLGIAGSDINRPIAARLVAAARSLAAIECRIGVPIAQMARPGPGSSPSASIDGAPVKDQSSPPLGETPEVSVADDWRCHSAQDIARLLIANNPKMFVHRTAGRRAAAQTGEQSER